jgi:hypothetical protein
MEPQQSTPFLQGDPAAQQSDLVDLRNDNAGSRSEQAQSIVLRYLRSLPAQGTVDLESMVSDITRNSPFQGDPSDFFQDAVKALEAGGLVKSKGDQLQLDKTASVARRFLARCLRVSR